ncbi:MAG: putative ABC transporter permease [Lachnospiraceae bacterium]|nr:putative ABC transporter permease [Lachnospiraceae bacterium]
MNYTFYDIIWIFISYAFLGWCAEVIYAASIKGHYINRGFNTGPVCPIYGVGMLSVLMFLEGIKDNLPLLFISSVIFTSVIEFLVGFVLEKLFHEKWWDYTNEPFNIKGYICLRFSILWGLACVFKIICKVFARLFEKSLRFTKSEPLMGFKGRPLNRA